VKSCRNRQALKTKERPSSTRLGITLYCSESDLAALGDGAWLNCRRVPTAGKD